MRFPARYPPPITFAARNRHLGILAKRTTLLQPAVSRVPCVPLVPRGLRCTTRTTMRPAQRMGHAPCTLAGYRGAEQVPTVLNPAVWSSLRQALSTTISQTRRAQGQHKHAPGKDAYAGGRPAGRKGRPPVAQSGCTQPYACSAAPLPAHARAREPRHGLPAAWWVGGKVERLQHSASGLDTTRPGQAGRGARQHH